MTSLPEICQLQTCLIHIPTALQANITITANKELTKWSIYLLDEKFNKYCLAASYISNCNQKNGINHKIFYDRNICLFHQWLYFNNNIKFLLENDDYVSIPYDDNEFKFTNDFLSYIPSHIIDKDVQNNKFPNIATLKEIQIQHQAWRMIQTFRIELREKVYILFSELPFISLQYSSFINHHIHQSSNIMIKMIHSNVSEIIDWFQSNTKNEQYLDAILTTIYSDKKSYYKRNFRSKKLLGTNLFIYLSLH